MLGIFGRKKGNMMPEQEPQGMAMPQPAQTGFRAFAGILGDALLQNAGMQPIYSPMLRQRQQMEFLNSQRETEFADWKRKIDYQSSLEKPKKTNPYRWQSNDGDQWEMDPETGQINRIFDDPTPKYQIGYDGKPYALPGTGLNALPPKPGTEEDGFVFMGGDPANPQSWRPKASTGQPMAPQMQSQQGFTLEQYRELERVMTPEGAAAYVRNNRIPVGNF